MINCNFVNTIDECGVKPSWYKLLFHGNPQTVYTVYPRSETDRRGFYTRRSIFSPISYGTCNKSQIILKEPPTWNVMCTTKLRIDGGSMLFLQEVSISWYFWLVVCMDRQYILHSNGILLFVPTHQHVCVLDVFYSVWWAAASEI